MNEHFDIVIIGSGAGGGTILGRLAPTGKRILMLERGGFLPRERENWDAQAVGAGRYRAQIEYRDRDDKPFRPYTHHWVGGNTKLYGAALLRLREHDFGEVRHHGGVSPAWPLSYAAFESYYSEAEWLYHVHGARGVDPYDPPASRPYRHAPLAHEPSIAKLAGQLRSHGLQPFPLPIAFRPPEPGQPAVSLSLFDGYPDPTGTKADAHVIAIAPALREPNVTLRTGRWVERLTTNDAGTAIDGMVAHHGSEVESYSADLVIVACGAIESAALFLRSASAAHPRGLANQHDLVGRHYMSHHNGALLAIGSELNDAIFQKTLALTDFYRQGPDSELPLGAVQMMGRTDPAELAPLIREVLPNAKASDAAARCTDFWLTAEDLPVPENRVTLGRAGAIQVHYRPTNLDAFQGLREQLSAVLRKALGPELVFTGYRLDVSGVSHQCGTLRFGTDPATSVLDSGCRAHGIDNLYVVDASFFPASGAVNPSLTIIANALRVGDQLIARLRA